MGWQALSPEGWLLLASLLGLCVGSFANVVVYRLPLMMEREWEDELLATQDKPPIERPRLNLALPASHCPACGHTLKWSQNIPVVSYLFLKGRCAFCGIAISWRYPAVEIVCAVAFALVAWAFQPGLQALALMALVAVLLMLALIDLDTFLLPDSLTLPLVWAGLLYNLVFKTVPLEEAVIGAMSGYLILWTVYQAFKLATGKEGMGYGDFKLLAAAGAWFGAMSLMSILLVSSVLGVVLGVCIQLARKQSLRAAFPFGPSIVIGMLTWMAGFDITRWLT